jgi:hypothetical protein
MGFFTSSALITRPPEARDRLAELKEAGCALDQEFREFRTRHAVRLGRIAQIVSLRADSLCDRAQVEREWRDLLRRGAQWKKAFDNALRELADARGK